MTAKKKTVKATALLPADTQEQQTRWSLLYGTLVWFLHLNLVYAVPSLACKWGWFSGKVAGISSMVLMETVITIIALLAMAYLVYLPWRQWNSFQEERPTGNPNMMEDTEKDRRPLVAFIAMTLNGFYLLFIVAAFVPIFSLLPCGPL